MWDGCVRRRPVEWVGGAHVCFVAFKAVVIRVFDAFAAVGKGL
jgi:hypothetical protein